MGQACKFKPVEPTPWILRVRMGHLCGFAALDMIALGSHKPLTKVRILEKSGSETTVLRQDSLRMALDVTDRCLNALEQSESEPERCKYVNERSSTVRWYDTVELSATRGRASFKSSTVRVGSWSRTSIKRGVDGLVPGAVL